MASSSDGQHFATGGRGEAAGLVNARYGRGPGVLFYTHVSDQYAPFHTQVINATARDATFVLDGLLRHESELAVEEHYTDTAGFTDHVFALCHLLGFRFAPRIRDLGDRRLYTVAKASDYPTIEPLVATRIKHGADRRPLGRTVAARDVDQAGHDDRVASCSAKLGSYPRQNRLALALRETRAVGADAVSRSTTSATWGCAAGSRPDSTRARPRTPCGGPSFFNRLGELRDRTCENQGYRASGLNLVVASVVLWNTVYLERAVTALRQRDQTIGDDLLAHLSPLAWEHVNLTGDYARRGDAGIRGGRVRPLRTASAGRPTDP